MIQCVVFAVGPLPFTSFTRPPDVTHVMDETRPSPFFALFRFRVLYWTQTEEQKTGEAWEWGYQNVGSLWPCGSEVLALPTSEECCHNTSASNVYIGNRSWSHEDRAMHVVRTIIRTEWSDRSVFMRRMCFLPLKPYLQLRGTLLNYISMLWKCIHGKSSYCSW